MLTDFPYWQAGGGGLFWPVLYLSSDGVNWDNEYDGNAEWLWTRPPSHDWDAGAGVAIKMKIVNPNAYVMKIYWNAFGGGVTGPAATTTIPAGGTDYITCSDAGAGLLEKTSTGTVKVVIGGSEFPIAGDGSVEGMYSNGL